MRGVVLLLAVLTMGSPAPARPVTPAAVPSVPAAAPEPALPPASTSSSPPASSSAPAASVAAAPAGVSGTWQGAVELPGGPALKMVVAVAGPAAATLSIPAQGIREAPLKSVKAEGTTLDFTFHMEPMPAGSEAVFKLVVAADGASASGTMTQGGLDFKASFTRLKPGEAAAGARRPQEPQRPLPYREEAVLIVAVDGAELPGTLTLPEAAAFGEGPYAAAVLITGSGTQDRDESLLGHRPFLVLSDRLTRAGIAVLRVDDRGWGKNKNPAGDAVTTHTFAGDTAACVRFLLKHPSIDAARIGLIGHSEGAVVAPMVAVDGSKPAFMVLMAGSGVPGDEVLLEQAVALGRAEGLPEASLRLTRERQAEVIAAAKSGDAEGLKAAIERVVNEDHPVGGTDARSRRLAIAAAERTMGSAWMRAFLQLDPRDALKSVRCPVLVLNGALDAQVVAAQNVPEITRALLTGGNTDVTVWVVPGVNHLFQPCKTGAFSEYGQIETTMDEGVLKAVTEWVRARTSRPR